MKSFTHTDLPDQVAHATSKCGILSSDLITIDPSIAFPSERLVSFFFMLSANSDELRTSPSLTIVGFGFGICIHTASVPGIGAMILIDFTLSDEAISFLSHSIVDILIPASGLILICTIDGQISNHSILIGTLNSISLSCKAFAFSIRNFSSIVVVSPTPLCMILVSKVGLSLEKLIFGLALFGSFSLIFSSTFCLMICFNTEGDMGCPIECAAASFALVAVEGYET